MTAAHGLTQSRAHAYAAALQNMAPTHAEASLLAACLRAPDVAAPAWKDFIAVVGDAKRYFESNRTGLKALLPFVESRLAANGIDAGKAFHTYARVASVREELRGRIYLEILASTLAALDAAGVFSILLKGGAASISAYPQPSWRHNHAIDLWVDAAGLSAGQMALLDLGCTAEPMLAGVADHRIFRHITGLAIGLHSKPFYLPHFEASFEELGGRTFTVRVGEAHVRVLSAEDALVHVCGHALYSRSRANLRWVCDAYYLIGHRRTFDWDVAVRTAVRARLALPMCVVLRWLAQSLAVEVSAYALNELATRSTHLDRIDVEGVYASMLHSAASPRVVLRWTRGHLRTMCGFLKFGAMPSFAYAKWQHDTLQRWMLPYYYVTRVLKFATGFVRRRARRIRFADHDADRSSSAGGVI